MRNIPVIVLVVLAIAFAAGAQQEQPAPAKPPATESKIPREAANQANPVKPTPASIAAGKRLFGFDCAMCHGATGDGKGDLAADMKLKMADFRDAAAMKNVTDGEMFYIIKNGKGDMPSEGDRAKPDEIWNLVNYIRSLAKKEAAAQEKPGNP